MEKHVKIIAILYLVLSFLGLILAFFLYYVLNLVGHITDDPQAGMVLSIVTQVLTVILVASAIPGIIGGLALLRFKEWGRILIIIISIINLLNFPLGTALGIYSIWALVHRETLPLFNKDQIESAETNQP
ncbi:hypothetical protein [Mangrovibacterium lignilyticum]|uniref:hypothetical protein n=1 Tax=Mangrovibacterium lignilyticum TaxID=2668052 RepID=UPI0013D6CEB6|nr:hypothetical protein [Mangrovibacterium lignilyticum]